MPEDNIEDGTITRVTKQKKNGNRVSIFVNDRYSFSLSIDSLLDHGLSKGMEVSVDQIEAMIRQDEWRRAKDRALHFVAHRPRTKNEVRRKLTSLDFQQSTIEKAIQFLEEYHFLDDQAFALEYVASRFRSKGLGPLRLAAELRAKGVQDTLIREAIATLPAEDSLRDRAVELLSKKWPTYQREDDAYKRKNKSVSFLVRRGFNSSIAFQAFDLVQKEADSQ